LGSALLAAAQAKSSPRRSSDGAFGDGLLACSWRRLCAHGFIVFADAWIAARFGIQL
jgi:hypothetical protein